MSLFVKEITCENEFPDIVSVICVNGSGVIDECDYVPELTCEGCAHESDKMHMPFVCETCSNAWANHYIAKVVEE